MNLHVVNYCKVLILLVIMEVECLLQLSVLAAKPFLRHTLAQLHSVTRITNSVL